MVRGSSCVIKGKNFNKQPLHKFYVRGSFDFFFQNTEGVNDRKKRIVILPQT